MSTARDKPKSKAAYIGSMLNPIRPLTRAYADIHGSASRIAQAWRTAKAAGKDAKSGAAAVMGNGTPKEKFERAYAQGGWSELELARQVAAAEMTRLVFLAAGMLVFPASFYIAMTSSWWLMVPIATVGLSTCAILLMMASKHAWWSWQLRRRSLDPFVVFFSDQAFWRSTFRVNIAH